MFHMPPVPLSSVEDESDRLNLLYVPSCRRESRTLFILGYDYLVEVAILTRDVQIFFTTLCDRLWGGSKTHCERRSGSCKADLNHATAILRTRHIKVAVICLNDSAGKVDIRIYLRRYARIYIDLVEPC